MPKIIFQPLMITNPQSRNRLGHFLTPDYKSRGTPSGLAFLIKRGVTKIPGGFKTSSIRRPGGFKTSSVRRPGGFEIRRKKRFDLLKPGDL